jgi:cytochrome c biogenesis protein CcdA
LGLACIGETIIAFENALLGGVVASLGNDQYAAMLLGALVLFVFSVGAAIPVIIVTTTSGKFSDRIKTREILNKIQTIGSVVMIMIGFGLVFMFLGGVI